ncbi:MAG: hypothetical protein IJN00_06285, partial [Clostridia bacterium]|nr:hypothetical protein [Clostridia bacterium]
MLPWLLLLPAGILLPRLAADHPQWIEEYYAGIIYPFISRWMGRINSLVSISIAECIIFALA